jgi:TRAP-type transport system periplasmic protein
MIAAVLLVASMGTAFAGGQQEAGGVKVIRAGHGQPVGTGLHQGFVYFKESVEALSNGAIKVEIYDSGQLGDDRELTEGLQLGNVTMTAVSAANLGTFAKEFYVLDTYFMFRDREHVYDVLDGAAGDAMLTALDAKDIAGLGYWENGFRHLTNSKRAITETADMVGIKIRVPDNPVQIAAWNAVGAGPAPMAWGELFTALQQKALDAQESTLESIQTMKFYEVQPYLTLSGHQYSPYVILMGRAFYEGLNAQEKGWVEAAIDQSIAKQREFAAENEKIALDKIAATGKTEIGELSVESKYEFRTKMATVYDVVKKMSGEQMFDLFIQEVDNN